MSYSFYVSLSDVPTYEEVFDALPPAVCCEEAEPNDLAGPMQEDLVLHVYQWGVSTRSVELAWERGTFSARILACSCRKDYRMALACVARIASAHGAEIESEEGVRFAPGAWEERYGDAWIEPHVRSMASMALLTLDEPDAIVTLMGPRRDFFIGPRLRREIAEAADDDAGRMRELFARMRAVFYQSEDEVFAANAMQITLDGGGTYTLTAWGPGVTYLFPKVDYLAPIAPEMMHVPFEAVEQLAGSERVRWLDEQQPLVKAIDDAEWDAFLDRCRAAAVVPQARREPEGSVMPPPDEGGPGRFGPSLRPMEANRSGGALVGAALVLAALGLVLFLLARGC